MNKIITILLMAVLSANVIVINKSTHYRCEKKPYYNYEVGYCSEIEVCICE